MSQRYRTTSLPHAYLDDGLDFDLDGYSIDRGKTRSLELKAGQTKIPLPPNDDHDDWQTIELFGSVELTESTVERIFPQDERSSPPARLFVVIQCHETIYRDKVVIEEPPVEPRSYSFGIELERDKFRNKVEIRPHLVRSEPTDHDGRYATEEHLRVASGKTFTALVDHDDDEGEAWIDGEEVSFSQTPHLPDGEKIYYLDFRNEARPKLWLNTDFPRITDVLQSDGSVGAEPRMRDVILDQIAYPVWTQLVLRTGSAVDESGEVEHQWQQTVLESFARDIYRTDDTTEAALALRRDIHDPDALPEVISRLDRELQDYIDPRAQLINLMEEGLKI